MGNLAFSLMKNSSDDYPYIETRFSGLTVNNAPIKGSEITINANDKILSLTIIGSSDKLNIYANAGSTPIATLEKSDWEARGGNYAYSTMRDDYPNLYIHGTGNEYIYGVRYYQNKALSVKRKKLSGSFVPSELEQNFKMDSKRYGIGSLCNARRFEDCLKNANSPGEKQRCREMLPLCPDIE